MPHSIDDPCARHENVVGIALREAKQAMRATVLALRDALDPGVRARESAAIVERVAALREVAAARALLVTLPFRSEWDTTELLRRALRGGKIVVAPRVNAVTRMLDLYEIRDPAADVAPGTLGIPEPLPTCPRVSPESIDVVIVPGIAFDPAGGRLGYGGGYYDRLLPLMRRGVSRIAGAFDAQIVDCVPTGPHDLRVECVVTPSRLLVAAP